MDPAHKPWTQADLDQLGTDTDTDTAIARRLGRTRKAVETRRRELGIAPARPHQRAWSRAEMRMLGRMTDGEIARRLGIARRTVLMERQRRGIKPFRRLRAKG